MASASTSMSALPSADAPAPTGLGKRSRQDSATAGIERTGDEERTEAGAVIAPAPDSKRARIMEHRDGRSELEHASDNEKHAKKSKQERRKEKKKDARKVERIET